MSGSRTRLSGALLAVSLPLAAVALMAGLVLVASAASDSGADAAGALDLETVPEGIADHYELVADHPDAYHDVPCYCGCESSLGHRDLYDCFVRADGSGWEAHAAGCGVCIAESVTVRNLVDDGADPLTIRDTVIEQFGSTTPTTPPPSPTREQR